jgi:hypothetical protein
VGVLVTLAAAIAFVRGFWATDVLMITLGRTRGPDVRVYERFFLFTNHTSCGLVWIRIVHPTGGTPDLPAVDPFVLGHESRRPSPFRLVPYDTGPPWHRLGFAFQSERDLTTYRKRPREQHTWRLWMPMWFVALLTGGATALLPARALRRARRVRLRREAGLCPACGYDLRGAKHERCPECGSAVGAPVAV